MGVVRRVVVLGLDRLEPRLVEPMLAAGDLPGLTRLRSAGAYGRVETTFPTQEGLTPDGERIIKDRLSGLGYLG